jgi:gliding motility-associated lipoprotein GldH
MIIETEKIKFPVFYLFLLCTLALSSCQTVDLFERVAAIPRHEWKADYKPQFRFTIKDTTALYDLYIVVRHNEKYEFNNILLSLTWQRNGDSAVTGQYELPLANNDGWLGTAMDDIYDHRIRITGPKGISFLRSGEYTFTIGQVMRKDPLENVLNVGLRIEKKPQ